MPVLVKQSPYLLGLGELHFQIIFHVLLFELVSVSKNSVLLQENVDLCLYSLDEELSLPHELLIVFVYVILLIRNEIKILLIKEVRS